MSATEVGGPPPSRLARGRPPTGAVVLGGDYRALGVVRSLGRHGVPVWVVRQGDDTLAARSRYAQRHFPWPGDADEDAQVRALARIADQGAEGWALIPSADETASLVARRHAELAGRFVLTTPPWDTLRHAGDKRLTYRLCAELGLDAPATWYPRDRADVEALELDYPVILKPAYHEGFNRLTAAKAWRIDDRAALLRAYDEACTLVTPSILMLQELVPGGGEAQFSYATLCDDGVPLASVVARRTRQYPPDFGRASTYVETVECPDVVLPARRLLAELRFTGLVEVEFKRDARDGRFKLLDVNPRVWGWHTLCGRAGVDFPYLLWRSLRGEGLGPLDGPRTGVRWVRTTTDLPMVAKQILGGRMTVRGYLRSLRGPLEGAIFARDDPAPGLLEVPLLASILVRRLVHGDAV
jgi:predicted ATP-grasp superfamily ATP-dependent carboligase